MREKGAVVQGEGARPREAPFPKTPAARMAPAPGARYHALMPKRGGRGGYEPVRRDGWCREAMGEGQEPHG